LHEALNSCSSALEVARSEKDGTSEVASLVQRVDVLVLLNRGDEAVKDAEEAIRLDPNDARVLLALGQVRLARKQTDEGISLLARAHGIQSRFDVAFVYAKALYDRGKEGDLDTALRVFRDLSVPTLPRQIRATVVTHVIQCFAKRNEWPEAASYLDQVSAYLDPVASKILRGYLAYYRGLGIEAEQYAAEALSILPADAGSDMKEDLARLFGFVGRLAEALPLWQSLFDLDQPGFDPGNLLDCAARLHRDDIVLKACEQLHARGLVNWHLLEFEIQYLEKYQIDVAIERLQAFIATHPEHLLARLRLSMIGVLLDKHDLVRADVEHLPDTNQLPLEYVIPAVQVIRFGGQPTAGVDYAYRFLREHFSDIRAHQALLMSMMPGFSSPDIPPSLEVAARDSAVCYQESPNGAMRWVVLEATQQPKSDFEEISLTSPLAEAFIGKRVGDTAVVVKGRMQDRTATIVQIVPKHVRRYQDSMMEMQVRFGTASPVESVRFGSPESASGEKGLEILVDWAKQRADVVTETNDIYRARPISLHLFGTRFGQNAYAALSGLAHDQTQQLKCSLGIPGEHAQALQSLQTAKALVVDITALATLRILGLTKVLSSTKYKFIVSQHTRITLHEMLSRSRVLSAPGATLSYEEGGPHMYSRTAEEEELRYRDETEFVRFVESRTEYRSGVALAALQPQRRELLEKAFGQYGAESIVIAADPDHVLWTDDLIQAQLSAAEFGTRRVWTQVVLGSFAEAGLISPDEYAQASARLIGMEFIATSFDASTVLAGFRLAGWSPQQRPATQFVKIFAGPIAGLQQMFAIFVSFAERLYREAIPPASRCAIARALFDALARNPPALASLKALRQISSRVFGINAVGQQQFDNCFDQWLEQRDNPLILPG
jgi:tetratricopeptide (TPR) repeat protein